MYKVLEAPSPNNNIKMKYDYHRGKIYYFAGSTLAGMAQDEAPRKRSFSGSLRSLARDFSLEEWAQLRKLLGCGQDPDEAEDDAESPRAGGREEAELPSPSSMWVGKGVVKQAAMDSASAASFAERYPEVLAVRPDPYRQDRKRVKPPSAADKERFEKMYPEIARVKIYE